MSILKGDRLKATWATPTEKNEAETYLDPIHAETLDELWMKARLAMELTHGHREVSYFTIYR